MVKFGKGFWEFDILDLVFIALILLGGFGFVSYLPDLITEIMALFMIVYLLGFILLKTNCYMKAIWPLNRMSILALFFVVNNIVFLMFFITANIGTVGFSFSDLNGPYNSKDYIAMALGLTFLLSLIVRDKITNNEIVG